jgi:PAS domain S-box-containing protein
MQRPQPEPVTLNDILITEELSNRSPRPPNLLSENQALHTLAQQMVNQPETMLQSLVDISLDLCSAGTAGVSLLETTPDGEEIFRPNVLAGRLAQHVGGTTPRNFSPCGVCLERGTPVLFSHPERYFSYFQEANTPIVEGLVLPLIADNHALGTIWIMSHDQERHFDAEDVRVMTSLADFTAAALLLNQRQTHQLLTKNTQLEAEVIEHKQAETALRESEAKYRSLFNSIDDGFCIIERVAGEPIDFRYIEVNPAFAMQTGISDVVGKTIREVVPGLPEAVYEIYENVLNTGEPVRSEIDVPSISRTLETYAFQTENESRLAVIFKDISDRKRHDANLAFLAEVSHDLARLTTIDETMNALGEKIGGYFDLSACVFAELSETAEIAVINYSWHLSHMPSFIGTYRMQDFVTPKVLQLCLAGEAVVIRDVFNDPLVDGDQYAALNIGSFLSIPLVRDGEWRFLLVIYHSEPHDWRDDEIELTHELANRIWTRLERARAEEQLYRAAEMDAFRVKLSDALRSLSDAVEIQATVTRTTMNFFGADRCYYCEIIDGSAIIRRDASQADLSSVVGVYALENSPIFRAMLDAGEPFAFQDVHTTNVLDENLRQTCLQLQIIAGINVPVIKQGEPVGILTITQSTPRNWTAFEMDLAEEIADRTWATIERTRAEAALRESEIQRVREQSAREQERQRAESLAELDRAKTLFFTHISHEFRTPLTLLLAPLQDALSDRVHPLDPVHRERLELVHRNNIRLLKLVNTLLDFSRIEAGRMEAVYEPTDLAQFTTELASVFHSAIEQAGLQLIVDCPPLPEPVYVDREMWEKIVLNLLSNAFKFTLEGEIAVRLHPAENHQVMLEIQDTGTGIAPEHLPHLFERFYQIRAVQARTHEGSGIGLALVHELIQLHGGAIAVSSTVGQGTCFTITLPFGTEHLSSVSVSEAVATLGASAGRDSAHRLQLDVGDRITATRTQASTAIDAIAYVEEAQRWLPADSDPPQPPLKRGENSLKVPLKREENLLKVPLLKGDLGGSSGLRTESTKSAPHILLVDDNADMREYLTRILSEHVHVEAFADGASALAAVQERVPDLVLTDVMMPGLDGFELLRALRTNPRTREVPIILLSARAGEEAVIEGLEAGADDYLIKPFSAQELVSRVNGHLQMAQLRLEALYQERTLNRRKDELLSTVSHELNTPLVAILGWTRLLRANPPNQSMLMKALETIERNATLQAKLVQDLLDMSRITAGKLRLKLEPVELESVIETAIATVSPTAQAKGLNLVWPGITTQSSTPRQEPIFDSVVVMGDRDRLQQILYNLLTNAIKFTPELGNINVELSVVEGEDTSDASIAVISITDTGIGISAEFLPDVFEYFRQAEHPDSAKGLGLGLAIARHLVELHGGTIQAESAGLDRGATFTIKLPL